MTLRSALAAAALLAPLAAAVSSQAAVLTANQATWAANVPGAVAPSTSGLALYDFTSAIPLADGAALTTDSPVQILQPLSGWGPWSGGYTGAVFDTAAKSVRIGFGQAVTALGFELSPDSAGVAPSLELFTVTLSDGTTLPTTGVYNAGATQFFGFYGGGIDGLTISVGDAPDFAFRITGAAVSAVPEPASLAVLGTGLALLGLRRRLAR